MSERTLRCLAFYLRHCADLDEFMGLGRSTPENVMPEAWLALWNLLDLASDQAKDILRASERELETASRRVGWRFQPSTRDTTLARFWEVRAQLFPKGGKRPFASLGATFGVHRTPDTFIHVWFGYHRARIYRGPRLAEVLRNAGLTEVCVADRNSGWISGTVFLGRVPVAEDSKVDDLISQVAGLVRRTVVENAEAFLPI